MTNQDHELVYNYEMPALVFGPKKRRIQPPLTNSSLEITDLLATLPVVLCLSPEPCFTLQFVKKSKDNPLLTQNFQ